MVMAFSQAGRPMREITAGFTHVGAEPTLFGELSPRARGDLRSFYVSPERIAGSWTDPESEASGFQRMPIEEHDSFDDLEADLVEAASWALGLAKFRRTYEEAFHAVMLTAKGIKIGTRTLWDILDIPPDQLPKAESGFVTPANYRAAAAAVRAGGKANAPAVREIDALLSKADKAGWDKETRLAAKQIKNGVAIMVRLGQKESWYWAHREAMLAAQNVEVGAKTLWDELGALANVEPREEDHHQAICALRKAAAALLAKRPVKAQGMPELREIMGALEAGVTTRWSEVDIKAVNDDFASLRRGEGCSATIANALSAYSLASNRIIALIDGIREEHGGQYKSRKEPNDATAGRLGVAPRQIEHVYRHLTTPKLLDAIEKFRKDRTPAIAVPRHHKLPPSVAAAWRAEALAHRGADRGALWANFVRRKINAGELEDGFVYIQPEVKMGTPGPKPANPPPPKPAPSFRAELPAELPTRPNFPRKGPEYGAFGQRLTPEQIEGKRRLAELEEQMRKNPPPPVPQKPRAPRPPGAESSIARMARRAALLPDDD